MASLTAEEVQRQLNELRGAVNEAKEVERVRTGQFAALIVEMENQHAKELAELRGRMQASQESIVDDKEIGAKVKSWSGERQAYPDFKLKYKAKLGSKNMKVLDLMKIAEEADFKMELTKQVLEDLDPQY